jgi:trehalose 6-phosphate phosphatase
MDSSLALSAPPPLATLLDETRIALFLDFDGTLVEIAPGPDAIVPKDGLASSLELLCQRLSGRCAIVSGRAIADIEAHIGPVTLPMAGSHGSDIRTHDGRRLGEGAKSLPDAIEKRLRAYAADAAIDYEQKPHGGALHYRRDPEAGPAAHTFAEKLAAEHGWAVQSGKCVVELVASDANKGGAVHHLMRSEPFAGAQAYFVGDDLTDEAGFAACQVFGGAGILVGNRKNTCARYRLPDVAAVHTWLEL